jgi:hypothetical protein
MNNIATRIKIALLLIVVSGMSLYFRHVDLKQGYVRAKQTVVVRANDPVRFDRMTDLNVYFSVIAACLAIGLIISVARMLIKRRK